jgi:isoleucyl-tRNA synthetase
VLKGEALAGQIGLAQPSAFFLIKGQAASAPVEVCTNSKCERCWKLLPDIGTIEAHPTLCGRCAEAED